MNELIEFLADYAETYPVTTHYAEQVEAMYNVLVEAQSWCRVDAENEASSARLGGSPTQDVLDARVERFADVLNHWLVTPVTPVTPHSGGVNNFSTG